MIFYRGIGAAALDVAPDQVIHAICRILASFQMPGAAIPNFRRNAVKIAVGGIYDLRQHLDEVIMPVLRYWRIFERDDFSDEGMRLRDELSVFISFMESQATKFEESKVRYLERATATARSRALAGAGSVRTGCAAPGPDAYRGPAS